MFCAAASPWLIEGPRGGGKTALGEALAQSLQPPLFLLQGMQGLTLDDVALLLGPGRTEPMGPSSYLLR